jgi:hypothetical protein
MGFSITDTVFRVKTPHLGPHRALHCTLQGSTEASSEASSGEEEEDDRCPEGFGYNPELNVCDDIDEVGSSSTALQCICTALHCTALFSA